MSTKSIVALVSLFLLLDLFIANITPLFIQRSDAFTYQSSSHLNLVNSLANFDGVHYIGIAKRSYINKEYAFLPLYPVLISFFSVVFLKNYPLTGVFISLVSFIIGLIILRKILLEYSTDQRTVKWTLLFLITFPTSFFFYSVYTEGLFFLLLTSTLYLFSKNKPLASSVCGYLAGLTKFVGVFLIVPLIVFTYIQNRKFKTPSVLASLPPVLGFLTYCGFVYKNTGDFLGFFHSQTSFDNQRTLHPVLLPQVIYRYIHIFLRSQISFQYFVAVFEFTTFIVFTGVLIYSLFRKTGFKKEQLGLYYGLGVFSLINLVVPTVTGTFLSIPRIALMSLTFFFVLAQIKSTQIKSILVGLFVLLHIVTFSFFSQGYFIS